MGSALKDSLKQQIKAKEDLEAEIDERSARLQAAGINFDGKLVDQEGFPRADIDVTGLRSDRQRIIVLSNDHKAITSKIEKLLQQLHAENRSQIKSQNSTVSQAAAPFTQAASTPHLHRAQASAGPSSTADMASSPHLHGAQAGAGPVRYPDAMPAAAAAAAASGPAAMFSGRPFAVVDEVIDGSPSATAGVQLGDQWISFGAEHGTGGTSIASVATVLQECKGKAASTLFLRRGEVKQLQLTPQEWSGTGLLGCHLLKLPT